MKQCHWRRVVCTLSLLTSAPTSRYISIDVELAGLHRFGLGQGIETLHSVRGVWISTKTLAETWRVFGSEQFKGTVVFQGVELRGDRPYRRSYSSWKVEGIRSKAGPDRVLEASHRDTRLCCHCSVKEACIVCAVALARRWKGAGPDRV